MVKYHIRKSSEAVSFFVLVGIFKLLLFCCSISHSCSPSFIKVSSHGNFPQGPFQLQVYSCSVLQYHSEHFQSMKHTDKSFYPHNMPPNILSLWNIFDNITHSSLDTKSRFPFPAPESVPHTYHLTLTFEVLQKYQTQHCSFLHLQNLNNDPQAPWNRTAGQDSGLTLSLDSDLVVVI